MFTVCQMNLKLLNELRTLATAVRELICYTGKSAVLHFRHRAILRVVTHLLL